MTVRCGGAGCSGQVQVAVLIESAEWRRLPSAETIVRHAIAAAAKAAPEFKDRRGEVSVLLCDDADISALNARWRGKNGPTNVLSFPAPDMPVPDARRPTMLGDIAVAFETTAREAAQDGKPLADHLVHLVIHGFLHLLGYDHVKQGEADRMEGLERDILAGMGISDPSAPRFDGAAAEEAK